MSEFDDDINIRGLDQLIKAFKLKKPPVIKIGVMQDKEGRPQGGPSNAEIGAAHEFGTTKTPMRSFLRIPLTDNLNSQLDKAGAFDKETISKVVKEQSLETWLEKIAIVGVDIVLGAFDSGGYGKWPPLNPKYANKKHNNQILVETGQLRDSIGYEIVT